MKKPRCRNFRYLVSSVLEQQKTIDAGTNPVQNKAKQSSFFGPVLDCDDECRNADADGSFLNDGACLAM
jgi:hypothetical protein